MITQQQIETVLGQTIDPTTGKDYLADKAVSSIQIDQNNVTVAIELGYPAKSIQATVRQQIEQALRTLPEIGSVTVSVTSNIIAHSAQRKLKLLPGVKTSSPWLRAKAVSVNPQPQPTWHWRSPLKAQPWDCWMQTSTPSQPQMLRQRSAALTGWQNH